MTLRKKISLTFFALVILAGLSIAGGYAYLYTRAQQDVDAILKRLFAGAAIHYDSLRYFPWTESIHLDGLRIGDSDPIRVERIVILQADRDAARSLVERRGAAVGEAGSYVRLAGDILVEGMLRPDGTGVSRLHLTGLDVFLSSIVWSEDVFAWEPLKFLDEASQVFRFETLAFEGLRLPSSRPGAFGSVDLGAMSFSGASDRQIERLHLSDLKMSLPLGGDERIATLRTSVKELSVEKLDMRTFFDGMDAKLAALHTQGNLAPLLSGVSLEAFSSSMLICEAFASERQDGRMALTARAIVDSASVNGLENGLLRSLRIEKISSDIWPEWGVLASIGLRKIEMENANLNAFATTFLPSRLSSADPFSEERQNAFAVLSFVRNGLVPLPLDRLTVQGFSLTLPEGRHLIPSGQRFSLGFLNVRNTHRDHILVENDTEMRAFHIEADEETRKRSWETLEQLGSDSLEVWLRHKETFDPENEDLHTTTEVTLTDMAQVNLDARMQGFPRNEAREASAALPRTVENVMDRLETMRLLSAEVTITDHSLLGRLRDNDADFQRNVDLLAWMMTYSEASASSLLTIVEPTVEFLKNGGTMVIALNPQPPVEVRDFSGIMRSLDRVVDRLGVVMTVRPPQAVP